MCPDVGCGVFGNDPEAPDLSGGGSSVNSQPSNFLAFSMEPFTGFNVFFCGI